MHQIPTEEALHLARLYHREQAARAERDYLADTSDRSARSHFRVSLIDGSMRVAAIAMFLVELLVVATR